jgi:hypothetical protein
VARLAGLATVLAAPRSGPPVRIADRDFTWTLPISIDVRLPERSGPEVGPLVPRFSFIHNQVIWGPYFQRSPLLVPKVDFDVLARAVMNAQIGEPDQ